MRFRWGTSGAEYLVEWQMSASAHAIDNSRDPGTQHNRHNYALDTERIIIIHWSILLLAFIN